MKGEYMVTVTATVDRPAELTRIKIVELVREKIKSGGYTLQQAAVKVCADLEDEGHRDELFELFVCEGIESAYRQALSRGRTGSLETERVNGAAAPPSPAPSEQGSPEQAPPEAQDPGPAERSPNGAYDPTTARGIGDQIIHKLPALTGRLAAAYWVAEGRYKPLGYLSADELDVSIARTATLAAAHQHSLRFQQRVRTAMGKEHTFVYQAFPDPALLDTLYEISADPAKP
jgi:hypothetical protein